MKDVFSQAEMIAFSESMQTKQDAIVKALTIQVGKLRDVMMDSLQIAERVEAERPENTGKTIRPTSDTVRAISKSLDQLAQVEFAIAAQRAVNMSGADKHVDESIYQYKQGLLSLDEFLSCVDRTNVLHVQAVYEVSLFCQKTALKGEQ